MIKFITHPAITHLLQQIVAKEDFSEKQTEILIVSAFSGQQNENVHNYFSDIAKYRLANPSCFIIFLSFQSKEELLHYDSFGILALPGTLFTRLPFSKNVLSATIEYCATNELTISTSQWEPFAVNSCKIFIKQKISNLQHGGKLAYGNKMTIGIRMDCVLILQGYSELLVVLKDKLNDIKSYLKKDEIAEFFKLAELAKHLPDNFLQSVSSFANALKSLGVYSDQEYINILQLKNDIDEINIKFDIIQNQ